MSQSLHFFKRRGVGHAILQATTSKAKASPAQLVRFLSTTSGGNDQEGKDGKPQQQQQQQQQQTQSSKPKKPKKENFAKKYLEPASRGELNKQHKSGIPKLAARKTKGHEVKDDFPGKLKDVADMEGVGVADADATSKEVVVEVDFDAIEKEKDTLRSVLENYEDDDSSSSSSSSSESESESEAKSAKQIKKGKRQKQAPKSKTKIAQKKKPHPRQVNITHLFQGPPPEVLDPYRYDNCNETFLGLSESDTIKAKLFQQQRILKQRGGQQQQASSEANVGIDQVVSSSTQDPQPSQQHRGNFRGGRRDRPKLDLFGNEISQEDLDDPMLTPYQFFTYNTPHVESRREAKPIKYPTNRQNPPKEFTQKYSAFAFVSHVPRPVIYDESKDEAVLGSYKNPLHLHQVCETVANALNVPVTDVFASSMTSAFVGFDSPKSANDVFNRSESGRILTKKIGYGLYDGSDENDEGVKEFVSSAPSKECILQITNLPGGMTSNTIARQLYNILPDLHTTAAEDIYFSSPTTALIKQASPDIIQSSFLNNPNFHTILESTSRQILRMQPANFEVVHDKYTGPAKQFQQRKTTDKLVVQGDMPSDSFFLSHGGVLHLCNVPTNMTKLEISQYFDKYCVQRRDVRGSIEIVKCLDGHPTGRVYVGFDLESEMRRAWEDITSNGSTKIMFNTSATNSNVPPTPVFIQQVKERPLYRGKKLGERSERTAEELHEDLHTKWEQYVDPKDIEYLQERGVPRGALEDAFLAARFNNPTYGIEDLARVGERMHDDKVPGQAFEEFVKLYVETMKELIVTKEEPGLFYEGMFMPNEEVDTSLFDHEAERVAKLVEKRDKLV